MKYSLKEFGKTKQYEKTASDHARTLIFISILTLIISGFLSDIDVSFLRATAVLIGWSLFGTSLLIAFPSFLGISWTAIKRMELDDMGKSSLGYAILKSIIYYSAVVLTILSTLLLLGRL